MYDTFLESQILQRKSVGNIKTHLNQEEMAVSGRYYNSDWESGVGLVYGINSILISPMTQTLRSHFQSTPLFWDVIDALEDIQSGIGLRERQRAQHHVAQYMIDKGKLWFVGGGTCTRAVA